MSLTIETDLTDVVNGIAAAVRDVVAIDDDTLRDLLVAVLSRGHVLIEGIPGTGKTLLARTIARVLGLDFKRIQFTNDLMPSDIVGSSVWRPDVGRFEFVRGPLFANVVLADEINRTSPRTLSCLLEAMERGRVSVDGDETVLADPFFVLATRNPIEFHGTFPVPEAALDRFLIRVTVDYPSAACEQALYQGDDPASRVDALRPALAPGALGRWMAAVDAVTVSDALADYAHRVVTATRSHDAIALGVSPRAAIAWVRAARALARMESRDYVVPDDLKRLARPVLAHRIVLTGGGDAAEHLAAILDDVAVTL